LDLSKGLSSKRKLSEAIAASRLDAEYFQERYEQVVATIRELGAERIITLGELACVITNGQTPYEHNLYEGNVLFLTAEHIYDFTVDFETDKRVLDEHQRGQLKRTALQRDDLLVTIKGKTGNAAVVFELPGPANINQDVALLRTKGDIPIFYLAAFLNCPLGKMQMERFCTNQINPFLGLGNLKRVQIPLFSYARMLSYDKEVRGLIAKSHAARRRAKELLEEAKMEVEWLVGD